MRRILLVVLAGFGVLAAGCTAGTPAPQASRAPTNAGECTAISDYTSPACVADCPTNMLAPDGSCVRDLAATSPGDVVWAGTSEFVSLDSNGRPCGDIEANHVPILPLAAQDPHADRGTRPIFNWLVTVNAGGITFTYPPEETSYRATDRGNGIYYTGRDCPK